MITEVKPNNKTLGEMQMLNKTKLLKTVKTYSLTAAIALSVGGAMLPTTVSADSGMDDLKKVLQSQIEMMTPNLQAKVKDLSTDTKMAIMAILAMHNRVSDTATLRPVMFEVLSDYQTISMGIMT